MNFYAATLGELLIVEAFVFYIWLRVLGAAIQAKDFTGAGRKLFLTSLGLIVTSVAIFGIIGSRAFELYFHTSAIIAVTAFYTALIVGSFLFILAAAIENSYRIVILFFMATAAWTGYYLASTWL